jgi:hypothetical protein
VSECASWAPTSQSSKSPAPLRRQADGQVRRRRRQAQSEAEAATRLFPFSDLLEFDINGREERAHKLLIAIANKKIILIVLRKVIEARLSCLVLCVCCALFLLLLLSVHCIYIEVQKSSRHIERQCIWRAAAENYYFGGCL